MCPDKSKKYRLKLREVVVGVMWEESRRLCIGTEMMTGGVVQTAEFLLQV
jgi:hypothetical protein